MHSIRNKTRFLAGLILINFAVQIPYAIHQYGTIFTSVRAFVFMGGVFALFLSGYLLLESKNIVGYWLLLIFITMEFLFYIMTVVGEIAQGYGAFFHLNDSSLTLKIVFGIGYLNLFAAAYYLFLLIRYKKQMLVR
jgi:hypothetical protein